MDKIKQKIGTATKGIPKTCKKIEYNGPFTFELFPYDNILKSKQKFLKDWNKTK